MKKRIWKLSPRLSASAVSMIFGVCISGCTPSGPAATAAVNSASLSLANYQKNVAGLVEAFIADYRASARAKADELADAAVKAETGPDGKASAANIRAIEGQRLAHYAAVETQVAAMRAKFAAINQDAANSLTYLDALRQYFADSSNTAAALSASSDQLAALLTQLAAKAHPTTQPGK